MQAWLNSLPGLPWNLIVGLGATGIPMALLSSLVGMRQKLEVPLWWGLYAVWIAIVLSLGAPPFSTILMSSILAGVLHSVTQALLVKQYRRNNPWYADQMEGTSDARVALQFLIMGIVIGTLFGALVGLIAWGIARLF